MDNIRDYINYLKDPELVANFQRFFGVIRHDAPEIGSMLENGEVITNSPVVEKENEVDHRITNKFWYYLFLFGTYLGDEIGYAVVIPFLIWNIDSAVARKMVLVWAVIMYIGQSIKDIIQWPRPACPPVVRLQTKWSIEFGMPSTHAMISIALPYSVLQFISDRYQIDYRIGIIVVFFWCMLITLSRLYLGMHTVLDVIAGLLLAIVLLIPFVPLADLTDRYLMYNKWTPLLLLIITVSLIIIYPTSDQWTPTKGDTTLILGTCAGILTGGWLMVTLEIQDHFHVINPMNNFIIWPSLYDIGVMVVRSGLGYLCIVMSFLIIKYILCFVDVILVKCGVKIIDDVLRRHIPLLDITYKYVTFYLVSFNLIFVVPILQKLLHVERLSFYHEAK
ncbi:Phosphatidic acid phosphatase type 2/haloperoxidase [Cinara cedri]|uniref:Phosphatidic acid phosphatase type 2/haloperoxidase n=1 Tax=Cinara cedri TaxID=506608 RepID=A0A5E4NJS3_9HEMI|nr:Phosphatidic acid phosphatase type 2/haloperoxidase [Cinara cedri]